MRIASEVAVEFEGNNELKTAPIVKFTVILCHKTGFQSAFCCGKPVKSPALGIMAAIR